MTDLQHGIGDPDRHHAVGRDEGTAVLHRKDLAHPDGRRDPPEVGDEPFAQRVEQDSVLQHRPLVHVLPVEAEPDDHGARLRGAVRLNEGSHRVGVAAVEDALQQLNRQPALDLHALLAAEDRHPGRPAEVLHRQLVDPEPPLGRRVSGEERRELLRRADPEDRAPDRDGGHLLQVLRVAPPVLHLPQPALAGAAVVHAEVDRRLDDRRDPHDGPVLQGVGHRVRRRLVDQHPSEVLAEADAAPRLRPLGHVLGREPPARVAAAVEREVAEPSAEGGAEQDGLAESGRRQDGEADHPQVLGAADRGHADGPVRERTPGEGQRLQFARLVRGVGQLPLLVDVDPSDGKPSDEELLEVPRQGRHRHAIAVVRIDGVELHLHIVQDAIDAAHQHLSWAERLEGGDLGRQIAAGQRHRNEVDASAQGSLHVDDPHLEGWRPS